MSVYLWVTECYRSTTTAVTEVAIAETITSNTSISIRLNVSVSLLMRVLRFSSRRDLVYMSDCCLHGSSANNNTNSVAATVVSSFGSLV